MNRLSRKNFIYTGLLLFSMFFGAGNLIFPPFSGNQAGTSVFGAMLGISITAVLFPVLGVAAVAKTDGLDNLVTLKFIVDKATLTLAKITKEIKQGNKNHKV